MKLMKPSPVLGRNDFDLSHREVNTINFGEIMPFLKIHTVPGGKYEIRTADLIRAIPMVTSPFMRAKQHIDLWFVPYNLLWSRFNEFMVNRDEKLSSALQGKDFVPHVHMYELLNQIASQSSAKDAVGQDFRNGAYRLLDALGYPSYKYFFGGSAAETDKDKAVNLWALLAYNYIWYTEYRQQYYDDGDHLCGTGYHSYLYNADYLPCTTADSADLIRYTTSGFSSSVYSLCQMRYRCWKKDLFTGLLPSTQFGMLSTCKTDGDMLIEITGKTGDDAQRWFGGSALINNESVVTGNVNPDYKGNLNTLTQGIGHDHALDPNKMVIGYDNGIVVDVLKLRKAEAVQIWRENALRAGQYVEDNFEAHYGVKPKSHMHMHPVHVGSIDAPLNIGDIDSHAQTGSGSNQQLADVAGKGISSLGKGSFKFQTSDFGIILGLVSMLPETEYMSTGIERENQLLEREDYFIPEYARLGLQGVDSSTFFFGGQYDFIPGYAPRDYGYKQKLDKVHLDFFNATGNVGTFRSWVSPKYDVYDALDYMATHTGPRALPLSCLYVNPELFDVNFAAGVDVSRQFMVNYYFDVDAIQPMPVTGMPSY